MNCETEPNILVFRNALRIKNAVDSAIESSDHALDSVDPAPAAYLTFRDPEL